MLTKSDILNIMRNNDLRPLKRLGQNFLIDSNIVEKMLLKFKIDRSDTVIEIGPGLGALTNRLGDLAQRVVAVEIDKKLCALLSEMLKWRGNIEIMNKDILEFDINTLSLSKKVKIIGNLPYYITTPIVSWILKNKSMIDAAYIMVQKELALRMTAKPAGKDYGSLSCFVQFYTAPDILMDVKRGSFFPEPEVDSCVVRLALLEKPSADVRSEEMFFKVVHAGFQQRRKMLLNSLSNSKAAGLSKARVHKALESCGIDPKRRAETLEVRDFAALANHLSD